MLINAQITKARAIFHDDEDGPDNYDDQILRNYIKAELKGLDEDDLLYWFGYHSAEI